MIWTEVQTGTEIDEVVERQGTLGSTLSELTGKHVQEVYLGLTPSESEITATLHAAEGKKQVVMVTYNANFSQGQTQLVKAAARRISASLC